MKVWDLPTRLYHWLQVIVFLGLVITGYNTQGPHIQLGLILFILITWRFMWGFAGSDTSRFKQFIRSPKTILKYLQGQADEGVGHNPAGGWMVISLLLCLLLQCLSGLVLAGFADNLPFANIWLTDRVFDIFSLVHGLLFYQLLILVCTHISAVIGYKLRKKTLVLAMITGYQKQQNGTHIQFESNLRALLVLIAALLVTIAIVALS